MISYKRSRVEIPSFEGYHFVIEYDTRFKPQDVVLATAMTVAHDAMGGGDSYPEQEMLMGAATAVAYADFKLMNRLATQFNISEKIVPNAEDIPKPEPKADKPVPFPWVGVFYMALVISLAVASIWGLVYS